MEELLSKCSSLEALCKARRAEAWQRSQEYLQFEETFSSVSHYVISFETVNNLENNEFDELSMLQSTFNIFHSLFFQIASNLAPANWIQHCVQA